MTWSPATWSAAQNRKSEPINRIIVFSTQGGIGGTESACAAADASVAGVGMGVRR